jgi:lysophospholipase L1-like esterase
MGVLGVLVAGLLFVPTPIATEYVALGDSYAAGVGAGSYDAASRDCRRSSAAHPALWRARHGVVSFRFAACSDATTEDVIKKQVPSVTMETGLVTLTVGGNDAHFADVLADCTLGGERTCLNAVAKAKRLISDELPGKLDRVFAAIEARAPSARVVVLGYPRLFEANSCLGGLTSAKRAAINAGADLMATVTAASAERAGAVFVDVRQAFAGHGICGAQPWLHALTSPTSNSYHPNRSGQAYGYLAALEASTH